MNIFSYYGFCDCYQGEINRNDVEKKEKIRHEVLLMRGTWFAAFGAFGLLIFEYIKTDFYQRVFFLSWVLLLIAFVVGALAGAGLHLLSKRKESSK